MNDDAAADRNDEDVETFDDPDAVMIDDGPETTDADAPAGTEKKTRKSSRRDWIIRGVVFGTLAVLLVLALLDFRAKKAAEKTYETWQAKIKEHETNGSPPYRDELAGLAAGSPDIEEREQFKDGVREGQTLHRYVWAGILRQYPIEVYTTEVFDGRDVRQLVLEIIPPSEVMAADQARADQAKADQAKSDQAEADQTETDQTETDQTETDQTETDQTETDQAETDQAETDQAETESE